MLQREHSAILSTFIRLPFVIKIFVLSIFERPFYTGFTVLSSVWKLSLSKRPIIGFQDQLSLNAGQKYCRMLQREHSAILLTFIKLRFVMRIFVLSIFEWPFNTGFTVLSSVWKQENSGCIFIFAISLIPVLAFLLTILQVFISFL